jgi:YVTN family beta-propeller protein
MVGPKVSPPTYPIVLPASGAVAQVVEAEDYFANTSATDSSNVLHSWVLDYTPGHSGLSAMRALPDSGITITNTNAALSAPRLDFQFTFQQTGNYFVWVRMFGRDTNGDSVWVSINPTVPSIPPNTTVTIGPDNVWGWVQAPAISVGSPGTRYVSVYMREDGVAVDAIYLTNNASAPPVPDAPTIGTATAGNAQATVSFTAPASNGGPVITGYTVISNPNGITATGTASPITVTGLVNGTAYTFTVTAANSLGSGAASAASNSVTPAGVLGAPTIGTGMGPRAVAVNPVTNKIYVANVNSNDITVIDGATNATSTVTVGASPLTIAINLVTNKIYVANQISNDVTVIDGATNATFTVAVGASPRAIAINPVTNKIYVANFGDGINPSTVTVIDGATNMTSTNVTVAAGTGPIAVAVNPVTNKIYVANRNGARFTVIDGATNAANTVFDATAAAGASAKAVTVNPVTNMIYVVYQLGTPTPTSGSVSQIDGATNATTNLQLVADSGSIPTAVAVNPVTNALYVAGRTLTNIGSVTVIGGTTGGGQVYGGNYPLALSINPVTNQIYVVDRNGGSFVIDGTTNNISLVAVEGSAVAVNPVTNKIYVATDVGINFNTVTVIDGATNATSTVAAGTSPYAVAVNPVTDKIYVTNRNSANVTVIDGATNATSTVAAGTTPFAVAVNPVTNKIYVANFGSANVTVIDGATNVPSTVAAGTGPFAVAVNPVTNKIYVANYNSNNVTVIDGATNVPSTVAAGTSPYAVSVNPVTNRIYVANSGSDNVTVIDGATNATSTVAAGLFPVAVAVNPVTNKIYVANQNMDNVTVIDGAINAPDAVAVAVGPLPLAVAVNPVTNKIYVAVQGSTSVTVIDGATNATNTVAIGTTSYAVSVNPVTNKIYVANNGSDVRVIDGATNAASTVATGTNPVAVAVNPVTNKIYVANQGSANVTVITEAAAQSIPLTTAIGPLPGNQTGSPTPSFTFTATSSFAPTAPPVQGVYYQVDTWQGTWQKASGSGPFSGTTAALGLGTHIVYAFAVDGEEATSVNTGSGSSPLIGQMAAYVFTVVPPRVPDAPTIGTATAGNTTATVTFTAPASDGGSAITGYTVTSTPGGITVTGAASPITITGLANGTAYTFTVTAANAIGMGAASAASNSVTPAGVPGAPTIGTATPGNGSATISFTPPGSNGDSPITSFTVTCNPGPFSASAAALPITVLGLTNGTTYTCSVTATNGIGIGPASGTVNVTPAVPALVAVQSRKAHAAAGAFDLAIDTTQPIGGPVTVEPRAVGTGHQIVFQFNVPVNSIGAASAIDGAGAPAGTVAATMAGSEAIVTLTGVPDNQRVTVSLTGVNGSVNASASLGFLVGDVNNSRSVTATDILQVKGRSGQVTDATNFRFDLNASGSITASDILAVKGRSGLVLP